MIETKLRYADDTEDMGDFPLREGLSWLARKDAEIQRAMGRGTELVYGDRGGGKDLYAYVCMTPIFLLLVLQNQMDWEY